MTPSASRRPAELRVAAAAAGEVAEAGEGDPAGALALLDDERPGAFVGRRRDDIPAAEADQPAVALQEASELRVRDLHGRRRRLLELGLERSSLGLPLPETRALAGPVELGAFPLEWKAREHVRGPRLDGRVHARIERVGRLDPTFELGTELLEPRLRELPRTVDEHRRVHGLLAASSPLEERHVSVPARSRVDHRSATDGRLAAEDDAIAAGCDDGRGEPELRKALTRPHDPGRYRRSAVVDVEARPIRDRRELLERHVEPVARRERAGRQERVAPLHLVPLDARK